MSVVKHAAAIILTEFPPPKKDFVTIHAFGQFLLIYLPHNYHNSGAVPEKNERINIALARQGYS